ncbi:hypothetical protein BS50DRAFT_484956 [Corynespora cassiicola Philippines]|uniref:Transcription factor domain-containing protein n=1 Tax=Corynespora cassiicola Philippines TaxID=1448308 RepID=A0A2T2P4H8_CORCC|nr:hypothetical protein BS50DRAFT_484956 [Corynespora cassiicola Philippines]
MNLVQRHLVVCIVSLHRAVQQPGDVKDHLKPFHHHQACAARLLSNQIASISARNPEASLINQMCLFLSSQLQESAYGSWRSHLKGAQAILRIWGPESLIEACNFEYYNFLVVDVYGTTTSPSNMLSKSTIPQHISYLDLLMKLEIDTTTTLVPVPEDILIITIAANILRASRAGQDGLPTSTLEKLGISSPGLLERLKSFDPQIWAMKHRNDVESWVSLAICFQAATALYIILEETVFTNESHTELYNQLISSIHDLFDRRNSGGTHFKFILWPMVIAGIGAASRLDRSEIDYLCEKLETMTLVLGALAMRDAAIFLNKVQLQFEDQHTSQLNGIDFSMDWNQVCEDAPLFLM